MGCILKVAIMFSFSTSQTYGPAQMHPPKYTTQIVDNKMRTMPLQNVRTMLVNPVSLTSTPTPSTPTALQQMTASTSDSQVLCQLSLPPLTPVMWQPTSILHFPIPYPLIWSLLTPFASYLLIPCKSTPSPLHLLLDLHDHCCFSYQLYFHHMFRGSNSFSEQPRSSLFNQPCSCESLCRFLESDGDRFWIANKDIHCLWGGVLVVSELGSLLWC
jgi:hypothetical protein